MITFYRLRLYRNSSTYFQRTTGNGVWSTMFTARHGKTDNMDEERGTTSKWSNQSKDLYERIPDHSFQPPPV